MPHPDSDANGDYKLDTESEPDSGWLVLKNTSDVSLRRDPKSDSWVLSRPVRDERGRQTEPVTAATAAKLSIADIADIEGPGTRDPGSLPVGAYDWTIRRRFADDSHVETDAAGVV